MTRMLDPELHVEAVDGHPGRRRLVVTYRLEVAPDDPVIGGHIHEEVIVSARDEGDAPVRPLDVEFELEGEATIRSAGVFGRRLVSEVNRVDLDVEQDWWDTDEAGTTVPIAEFPDHLAAMVTVRFGDEVVAAGESPTVTGSWGALGSD
jgi:hypothetical protein